MTNKYLRTNHSVQSLYIICRNSINGIWIYIKRSKPMYEHKSDYLINMNSI